MDFYVHNSVPFLEVELFTSWFQPKRRMNLFLTTYSSSSWTLSAMQNTAGDTVVSLKRILLYTKFDGPFSYYKIYTLSLFLNATFGD